jgi:hypothetical protein
MMEVGLMALAWTLVGLLILGLPAATLLQWRYARRDRGMLPPLRAARREMRSAARLQRRSGPRDYNVGTAFLSYRGF